MLGPRREPYGGTTAMNGSGESDRHVVPGSLANKGRGAPQPAEREEGRGLAKGNPMRDARYRTLSRVRLNAATDRIRQAARKDKAKRFAVRWGPYPQLCHPWPGERLRV